jgi:Fur family peroxide stress response transcriptional regulator
MVFNGVRERVPTIALDTVYRTLSLLVELGLIDKLGVAQETMRFDGNMVPHHHFVCTRCGATHDFYSERLDHLSLPDDVQAFGRMQKVQVEVRGICQRCALDDQS